MKLISVVVKQEKGEFMDNTQKKLNAYISETQYIAEKVLRTIDKNAWFKIIPAIDIGIPYDVDRLAGGFPTGIFVEWSCKIPIIPIDTTVNCCTASVFSLSSNCDDELFKNNLLKLNEKWKNSSYLLNFDRGNHFISLCSNDRGNRFLVMHSTAKEFTRGYNGLYPIKDNWYYDKIKVIDCEGRYFRYIQGKEAELFMKTAISLNNFNEIRHENIAFSLLENCGFILETKHFHHYGMTEPESIQIGCYRVCEGDIFPIFSKPNYSIDMYRVKCCSRLNSKGEYIVPHGWGKHFVEDTDIKIDLKRKIINIGNYERKLFCDATLYDLPNVEYRDFEEIDGKNGFYMYYINELEGMVEDVYNQNICLTSNGIREIRR